MSRKHNVILFCLCLASLSCYALIAGIVTALSYVGYEVLPNRFDQHDHVIAVCVAIGIALIIVLGILVELPSRVLSDNNKR